MFGRKVVTDMINRSAENDLDRRRFLGAAGAAGLGAVGATLLGPLGLGGTADAAPAPSDGVAISDAAILNFALNLEYLEAEFYSNAVYGHGISSKLIDGKDKLGGVTGGSKVDFTTPYIGGFAKEIAGDETNHVAFLRAALGSAKVARPAIDLKSSFTAAAVAAGIIKKGQTFDPFANEIYFLLGAFIFEDVGVTAYKGAAPLISNKTYLGAAAGILAVEAYHAGLIRSTLFSIARENPDLGKVIIPAVQAISNLRDAVDGSTDDDQGILRKNTANIVPTDSNGLAYSRTPGHVLNIAYLTPKKATQGGFFPAGVNGAINTSA